MTDDILKYFVKPNLLFNFSFEEHSLSEEWNNYITTWNKIYSENKNIIAVPNVINSQYVNWLIGTKDAQYGKNVADELYSFFGSHIGNFSKLPTQETKNNELKVLISKKYDGPIYEISSSNINEINKIKEKLILYANLLLKKPNLEKEIKKPFFQVRKEFDYALIVGDEVVAKKSLNQLIDAGRLEIENENYLIIRFWSGLKKWDDFDLSILRRIKDFKVPIATINDIAEYFFETCVKDFLSNHNLDTCIQKLEEKNFFKEFDIFFNKQEINIPKSSTYIFLLSYLRKENYDLSFVKSLLETTKSKFPSELLEPLKKLLLENKNNQTNTVELVDDISSINEDADEFMIVEEIVEEIVESVDDISMISEHIDNFEYDRAIRICFKLPPSKKTITKLYQCIKGDELKDRDKGFLSQISRLVFLN